MGKKYKNLLVTSIVSHAVAFAAVVPLRLLHIAGLVSLPEWFFLIFRPLLFWPLFPLFIFLGRDVSRIGLKILFWGSFAVFAVHELAVLVSYLCF